MTPTIIPRPACGLASVDNNDVAELTIQQAKVFADAAHADNTRRCYASSFRTFTEWCQRGGYSSLPADPQTIVLYVTDRAGHSKLATLRQSLAAIAHTHRENGLESPVAHEIVRRVVRGIARTNGAAQTKKTAVTIDALRAMLLCIEGNGLKAHRDRTLLLLGFSAALRRSELAQLRVDDVRFCKEGLRLTIRRSKTDQSAVGTEIAVPSVGIQSLCPVRALKAWLAAAEITAGPLFPSFTLQRTMTDRAVDGRDVAELIKRLADRAGLEGDFSGHSLRAGFVTAAARAKVSLDSIARTSRHKSLAVLMGYVRPAQAFDDLALPAIFT